MVFLIPEIDKEKKKLREFSRLVISWYATNEYKMKLLLNICIGSKDFFFLSNFGSIVGFLR